jgi:hypothetical protein
MTIHFKTRRPPSVTPQSNDRVPDADHDASAPVRTAGSRGRRSLAFGAAVLIGAAVIGGSGGAGAAGLLTGKNIRDDSLRAADFRDSSIGGGKVRDGGLSQGDLSFDLTGDQGVPGDQGPAGFPGIRLLRLRTGNPQSSRDPGDLFADANCDAGETALSGGAQLDSADPGVLPYITSSRGVGLTSWRTIVSSPGGGNVQYTGWVVCALVQ